MKKGHLLLGAGAAAAILIFSPKILNEAGVKQFQYSSPSAEAYPQSAAVGGSVVFVLSGFAPQKHIVFKVTNLSTQTEIQAPLAEAGTGRVSQSGGRQFLINVDSTMLAGDYQPGHVQVTFMDSEGNSASGDFWATAV